MNRRGFLGMVAALPAVPVVGRGEPKPNVVEWCHSMPSRAATDVEWPAAGWVEVDVQGVILSDLERAIDEGMRRTMDNMRLGKYGL